MGVLDGYTADQGAFTFAPAQQPEPTTGFFANLSAGYHGARAAPSDLPLAQYSFEAPYYDQIVSALNAKGLSTTDPLATGGVSRPRSFRNPYTGSVPFLAQDNPLAWRERERADIWSSVQRIRQDDPSFLKGLSDPDELSDQAYRDRQGVVAQSAGVEAQASTLGHIGAFLGSLAAAPFDPMNWAGGSAGAAERAAGKLTAKIILKSALREGGVNAAIGVGLAPIQGIYDRERFGAAAPSVGDMAESVATQAVFGGALGSVHAVAPHLLEAGAKTAAKVVGQSLDYLPEPIKTAAMAASLRAGTVGDRAITTEVRRNLDPYGQHDRATPDDKAALAVSDRDVDTREASPFHPDPASTGANDDRLSLVEQSLGITHETPEIPTPAPMPEVPRNDLTAAINKAEGTGKNPNSSAEGYGQFTRSTWLSVYKRHFGGEGMSDSDILALRHDPKIGAEMTAAYASDNAAGLRASGLEDSPGNISLAHFLGLGGARDVLRAAPDTPVADILPPKVIAANQRVLEGRTAADVIEWAHKRIGGATGLPVARGDAVPQWDAQTDQIPVDAPPIETASFRPDEIEADAPLMQYKSGGDENGVTERLRGVEQWNPVYSGKSVVWQDVDGRNVIVDGHQRLGLAKRLYPDDPSIRIDAMVLREADGVTAQQARVIGALKNIAEGSGDAIDAARILREAPVGSDLPRVGDTLAAQANGLAALSNEAFGAVLNDVVDPAHAARIGRVLADSPELHMAMIDLLRKERPRSAAEAEAIVRQANADGFGTASEQQLGMFGDVPQQSLYGPAARVLEGARRALKNEKRTFKTLTTDASRIESAGNVLDRETNKAKVVTNEQAAAIIDATAHTTGPVRSALLAAAKRSLDGDHAGAVRQFLDALDGIDLKDVAAGVGEREGAGGLRDASGRALEDQEADRELADGRGLQGRETPYESAVVAARRGEAFSDPVDGPGPKLQTQSVEHDLQAEIASATPHISEDVADELIKQGFHQRGSEFEKRVFGVMPAGQLSDGTRILTLRIDESGRWLERLDGFDVANEVDLRDYRGDPAAAIATVLAERSDPAISDRRHQETELRAASPLRKPVEQEGTMGLDLFDSSDQPTFRLSEEGEERTLGDILKSSDSDLDAVEKARGCLAPPKMGSAA